MPAIFEAQTITISILRSAKRKVRKMNPTPPVHPSLSCFIPQSFSVPKDARRRCPHPQAYTIKYPSKKTLDRPATRPLPGKRAIPADFALTDVAAAAAAPETDGKVVPAMTEFAADTALRRGTFQTVNCGDWNGERGYVP
jgi:hypothetical protein